MADSQSGRDSPTDSSLADYGKKISKTTETLEVLLQGLKLYLASFFFLNKCIHVQLEAFFLLFVFFINFFAKCSD